jgi:hypothetical protein
MLSKPELALCLSCNEHNDLQYFLIYPNWYDGFLEKHSKIKMAMALTLQWLGGAPHLSDSEVLSCCPDQSQEAAMNALRQKMEKVLLLVHQIIPLSSVALSYMDVSIVIVICSGISVYVISSLLCPGENPCIKNCTCRHVSTLDMCISLGRYITSNS